MFNVGDAVIALKDSGTIIEGNAYLIEETKLEGYAVRIEGHPSWSWYPSEWFRRAGELISSEQIEKGNGMTKEEYMKVHYDFCMQMIETTKRKNHDYTGTNLDPFANFRAVSNLGICSTEQGFLVRMMDKVARITSFVQKGVLQVKDESIEDTLLDLANYSLLLAGFIRSEKEKANGKETSVPERATG